MSEKTLTCFLIEVCGLKGQSCNECGIMLEFDRSGNCHCKNEGEIQRNPRQIKYSHNIAYALELTEVL